MMVNNFFKSITLILASLIFSITFADTLETSIGSTIARNGDDEGLIINMSYINNDRHYPIEYAVGFIEGPDNISGRFGKDIGYISVGMRRYWNNFFLGLGGAAVSDTSDRLSSTLNFKTQIGYHYKSWIIKVEHLSNAGIRGENKGESLVTIGYTMQY